MECNKPMTSNGPHHIIRAKVNGNIVIIDMASEKPDAYQDMIKAGKVVYLGIGRYYKYDNNFANDKRDALLEI